MKCLVATTILCGSCFTSKLTRLKRFTNFFKIILSQSKASKKKKSSNEPKIITTLVHCIEAI